MIYFLGLQLAVALMHSPTHSNSRESGFLKEARIQCLKAALEILPKGNYYYVNTYAWLNRGPYAVHQRILRPLCQIFNVLLRYLDTEIRNITIILTH